MWKLLCTAKTTVLSLHALLQVYKGLAMMLRVDSMVYITVMSPDRP